MICHLRDLVGIFNESVARGAAGHGVRVDWRCVSLSDFPVHRPAQSTTVAVCVLIIRRCVSVFAEEDGLCAFGTSPGVAARHRAATSCTVNRSVELYCVLLVFLKIIIRRSTAHKSEDRRALLARLVPSNDAAADGNAVVAVRRSISQQSNDSPTCVFSLCVCVFGRNDDYCVCVRFRCGVDE